MSIELIEPTDYHFVSTKLRSFFEKKGLLEVPVQHRIETILAACEDPMTLGSFSFAGKEQPLPQTGQMQLEFEIMREKHRDVYGFFCFSTSFRNEPNPVPGRHNLVFPMVEYEIAGDFNELLDFHAELLEHLGYGPRDSFPRINYVDLAKRYGVEELDHVHEAQMYKDFGPVTFLMNFPEHTSPFWNMSRDKETGLSLKCDVIMSGHETIGSAERSNDPAEMRKRFHTISDGIYAALLYSRFGKERVERELEEFLRSNWKTRSGAGCGMTRLINSMKKEGLMPT